MIDFIDYSISSCCCSVAKSCPTLCNPMASLSITISRSLLKLISVQSMMPSNCLILCRPLLLLPLMFPSSRVFSNEPSSLHHVAIKNFSFSISPSNEYSGLISFLIDWFDLLAVQGTLKSLLQHHSSKASILWHSELEHVCFQTSPMISIKNTFCGNRICLWWFETSGVYFLT